MQVNIFFVKKEGYCKACTQVLEVGQLVVSWQDTFQWNNYHYLCFRVEKCQEYQEAAGEYPAETQVVTIRGFPAFKTLEDDKVFYVPLTDTYWVYNEDDQTWKPRITG